MPEFNVAYTIDGVPCGFKVQGELAPSSDRCLIDGDDNLLAGRKSEPAGVEAVTPWGQKDTQEIQAGAANAISDALKEACGKTPQFALDKYHTVVSNDEHYAVIRRLRDTSKTAERYFPLKIMDEGMSRVLGFSVTCWDANENYFDCWLRIIRPRQPDNNPLHRDVWLNRLRNALNIYAPIIGSNELTSLSMIPGSHHWKESDIKRTSDKGCVIDGVNFTVSSVVEGRHGLAMTRPPLEHNEILMFSPYLVHGGARNLSDDTTRISLEMRFRRT